MKKKTLALIATLALALSMTACGGKTEETANNNTNEPVAESQVEQDVAEPTEAPVQESEEVVENTEPVVEDASTTEEAPVEEEFEEETPAESPIEISELIYPNGEPDSDEFDGTNQPYFIVTNTSDTAYTLDFSRETGISDDYFEPNESIILPGIVFEDENGYKWGTMTDGLILVEEYGDDIFDLYLRDYTDSERNRVQDMITITNGDTYPLGEGNENESRANYVIFYDAEGNVIPAAGAGVFISETSGAFNVNAEFEWATADVYYSYTEPVNQ